MTACRLAVGLTGLFMAWCMVQFATAAAVDRDDTYKHMVNGLTGRWQPVLDHAREAETQWQIVKADIAFEKMNDLTMRMIGSDNGDPVFEFEASFDDKVYAMVAPAVDGGEPKRVSFQITRLEFEDPENWWMTLETTHDFGDGPVDVIDQITMMGQVRHHSRATRAHGSGKPFSVTGFSVYQRVN